MTTLAATRNRIRTLTNGHVGDADIDAMINRVHQAEVESGEWHYRQKHTLLTSYALKSDGTVTVAQGSATVYGTGTNFLASDIGNYIRLNGINRTVPIKIADVILFPSAINFSAYAVDDTTPVHIVSSFGGIQGTKATITVLDQNIRYTLDGTTPTPTVGHQIQAGNEFVVTGHTNLENFQMIAELSTANVSVTVERTTQTIEMEFAWPEEAITDGSYEIFQRYYALPADCDTIMYIGQQRPLDERTMFEISQHDPDRNSRADVAYHWVRAGVDPVTGQKLIELWPITTTAKLYMVEYLAGHTPLVNDDDLPLVPPTILENKGLQESCMITYAKTGDQRWLQMSNFYKGEYDAAIEKAARADMARFGKLKQVLESSMVRHNSDYAYMVDHDVDY